MKNLICLILTLALLLAALCGCSKPAESGDLSTAGGSESESKSEENSSNAESCPEPPHVPVFSTSAIEPEGGLIEVNISSLFFEKCRDDGESFLFHSTMTHSDPLDLSEFLADEVSLSFELPEGWSCSALLVDDRTYALELYRPEREDSAAEIRVYKDDGTVFDKLLEYDSLLTGLGDMVYFEIDGGNFSKGSYINIAGMPKLFDEGPNPPSDSYNHQLQFEGYVVSAKVAIFLYNVKSDCWLPIDGEKDACERFINSINTQKTGS